MLLTALTRSVGPSITECALSFIEREPIDVELAERQHRAYEDCLRRLGVQVIALPAEPDLPDAVFVEDAAVVTDEIAVTTAPLLPSRRAEVDSVAAALAPYRRRYGINGTANLEGGDVLRIGRTIYVGLSNRTNREGIDQLAAFLETYGYRVQAADVAHCLHLKTACTYIGRNTLLANAAWVDTAQFDGMCVLAVPDTEPFGGNALLVGETVIVPASCPETRRLLEARGFQVVIIDISELEKAEAGLTCCSILFSRA